MTLEKKEREGKTERDVSNGGNLDQNKLATHTTLSSDGLEDYKSTLGQNPKFITSN